VRKGDLTVAYFDENGAAGADDVLDVNSTEVLFPDRLKNLGGYSYRVLVYLEYPFSFPKNNELDGIGAQFTKVVANHQRGSFSFKYHLNLTGYKSIVETFLGMNFDFSIYTKLMVQGYLKDKVGKVNTFETDGFCVMLPLPQRKSFFSVLIKPFDLWVWIAIICSVAVCAIVWFLVTKTLPIQSEPPAFFMLAAFSFMLNQGMEMKERSKTQALLVLIVMLLTMIFTNLYESQIVSLMFETRYGRQLTTIQEMIDSNFTLHAETIFLKMFNASEQYQQLGDQITGVITSLESLNFSQLSRNQTGLIMSCQVIDMMFQDTKDLLLRDKTAVDFYYRLPERFYSFYMNFITPPNSIFTDRLQDYSLRIHESGIKQHWRASFGFEDMEAVKQRQSEIDEGFLLKFEDIAGAFYYLAIGCGLATIAFVSEMMLERLKLRKRRIELETSIVAEPRISDIDDIEVIDLE
jgi:hypothetical protein